MFDAGIERQSLHRRPAGRPPVAASLAACLPLVAFDVAAAPGALAAAAPPVPVTQSGLTVEQARAGLSGVWIVTSFVNSYRPLEERITRTIEGDPVPLLPWAQKIYDQRLADARAGKAFADTEAYCIASGMPRVMRGPNYPMQILQTPGQITMLFEALHNIRFIYLDEPLPPQEDWEYSLFGHSVGRWEGDTLVVETVGLTDLTTLDKVGLPHTKQLRVTERIRLTSPDTFEDVITIDDPGAFTRPWSIRATYKRMPPGSRISEYECNLNNRNRPTPDGKVGFETRGESR
jgi:hypothetical protein